MVRYSLVLLLGLCLTAPAAAAPWADRLFDELAKDFGSVPRGPALVHHFRVANTTTAPINIASTRASCGCVTAQILKNHLLPGEETAILVRMDTTRFTGARSVTIYVVFDRPSLDEARLLLSAVGRDDFTLSPDTLAFGQVRKASTGAVSTTITFYGQSPVQITDVRSETNYVRATVEEVSRKKNVVVYQLTAYLRNDAPVGRWFSDIWLKTNNTNLPQIRVPVTVDIESALSVSPEVVVLGPIKVKGEAERRVIVRGVKPFRITSIDGTDEQLQVEESNPDEKKVHVVSVRLKGSKAGNLQQTIRLHTSLAEDNEVDFQVQASVTP
jgi:hypothetical protein